VGGCEYITVSRGIDGDTFIIENGERVRLIGIDTPETVDPRIDVEWFGREASRKLKSLIQGKRICLVRDRDRTIDRGKYSRLLRYAWVGNTLVNRVLLEEGYAFAYVKYPFQYLEDFRVYEKRARLQGAGLWNKEKHRDWGRIKEKNFALARTCGEVETICPGEARDFVGQEKTVRFFVRKAYDAGDRVFLNSENDYRLKENFTVMILKSPEMSDFDLEQRFWGKTIDVTGEIKLYKKRVEIVITDLLHVRIVQPVSEVSGDVSCVPPSGKPDHLMDYS
jgi:micrococcal nuclease